MPNKLEKLTLNRVDVVDNPSNPLARVVLFKRDLSTKERNDLPASAFAYIGPDGERHLPIHDAAHVRNALARLNQTDIPAAAKAKARRKILAAAKKFGVKVSDDVKKGLYDAATTAGVMDQRSFMEEYNDIMSAFYSSMDRLMYDGQLTDAARVKLMKESVDEAASLLSSLFDEYPLTKSENDENDEILAKVEKTVDVLQEIDTLILSGKISEKEITEILEGLEMADKKTETNEVETLKAEVAAKVTALETASAEITKLQGEVAELKKAATATKEPEVEDIWKGVNPAIRAQFEELKKKADESERIAKESEETAAMVKLTKRVTDELNGIAGTIDEKAALLRSIEKVAGSKLFEKLYTVLKSASEAIKASEIVKEKGHTGPVNVGNTVLEKMKGRAKTMVDSGKAKSEAAAIAELARQDPSLYKEYLEEVAN